MHKKIDIREQVHGAMKGQEGTKTKRKEKAHCTKSTGVAKALARVRLWSLVVLMSGAGVANALAGVSLWRF